MENPGQNNNEMYGNGIFSGPRKGAGSNQNSQSFQGNQRKQGYSYNPGAAPDYGNHYTYYNGRGNDRQARQYAAPGNCVACGNCPYHKKTENTALIIIAVTSVITLLIAFLATIFCLISMVTWMNKQEKNDTVSKEPTYKNNSYMEDSPETDEGNDNIGENPVEKFPQKPKSGNGSIGDYYGELTDSIRTDLDYSIEWENYEYDGNNESIMISVDFPVIKGDVKNIDVLNQIIEEEVLYFEEFFEEYSQYMLEDEMFAAYSEGCVTYMDEDTMSVVFCENIYTDYWQDCGLYCINIDMENGVVIDNNSIIDVNNEFAVDFRIRSREQNGEVMALDYMTDQEITYYLSSAGTSIVFYTPIGMEIGINYGESYVTATYKDYEQFLKKY